MVVIKVNYTNDAPIIKVNYDDSPIYISTTVDATYIKVDYGTGGALAVWGQITGTLSDQTDLQNALDDKVPYTGATANVDLGEYELKAGQLTLDTSPTGTASVGTTRWNNDIGSSETTLKGGSVILKNGVDLVARVVNKVSPNTTLTKAAYQAVRVSGAQGQRLAVAFAQANNDNNSADTIGLVTETIATNQEGFIITVGQLEDINTTGSLQGETWADGDVLYLSPTTPGALTNVKPVAPQHIVVIGYVEYAHANHGKIYVKVMNGWELGELHDVDTTGATAGQVLKYNGTIWTPSSDTDTGITSLNGLTALSQTFATGTSGTDFNISSATSTHTFNLPTASATNRGLLSTTDWSTFNNKQNALGYTPVPTTRTLTINGTAFDLSADRSWTVSGTNIYTADGTLTGNRTVTLSTNSLTFLKTIAVATNAEGIDLKNDTASTVSNNSYSPSLTLSAFGWGGTGANTLSRIRQYLLPVSGTPWNQPSVAWDGWNSSAWTNLMTLKARGFGGGSPNGGLTVGNTSGFINLNVTNNQIDNGNSSGQLVLVNANGNGGVRVQGWNQYILMNSSVGISFHNGTNEMGRFYTATGNLLIQTGGTFADGGFKIDVQGTGRFTGNVTINTVNIGLGTSNISTNTAVGTSSISAATTGVRNTAVGNTAGQSITGSDNTIVGASAGNNASLSGGLNTLVGSFAGQNITSGSRNVCIGHVTGRAIGTGASNTYIGTAVVQSGTGSWNVAIGDVSSEGSSSAAFNTAIGSLSLQKNTTGQNNVALGYNAGSSITGNVDNLITNNSIYIGANTKALASNQTNQIVIGHNTTGLGSNTMTLGNSSIVTTAIYGNTIIGGTTDAGYKLDVQGTGRFTGNVTTAAGKITLGEGTFNDPVINFTAASKTSFIGVVQSAGAFITAGTVGDNFIRSQDNARFFYFGSGSGGASFFRFSYADASIIIDGNGTGTSFTTIPSSQLSINSTTKGFLPPRMTNAQRTAIATPAVGLIVYCTDAVEGLYVYKSTGWTFII